MTRIRAAISLSVPGAAPSQEDFVLPSDERGIFALADGFGGPVAGAAAARSACEGVRAFLEKGGGDRDATLPFVLRSYYSLSANLLFNAVVHANRELLKRNRGKRHSERGGASLVAGFLDGNLLSVVNIGCCSAWLFRQGRAVQLVLPKSYSRLRDPLRVQGGQVPDVPLMALGISEDLEPEISEFQLEPGDWLLFHSDGMPEEVRESIRDLQNSTREPSIALEFIRDELQQRQGLDNSSIWFGIFG